ncbi:MAG: ATP synthase F1 subunit delta [Muribaculaceae bacterium]|jgi:F-type H+-transporting ATPase subunit delta|nr:ATP synthase F1 subunit delta [Muribaculaceae bacterium]
MDKGLIPRRYAKALYEVGEERNANDSLYALMQSLAGTFASQPLLAKTLANPFVAADEKLSLLTLAAGEKEAGADATYTDFLKLLKENGRLDMARDIALAFIDLYRSRHEIYRVAVQSAAPMGDEERLRLQRVISGHIGHGTMEYDYSVDPDLIGGFIVTVNSERLDASVRHQLEELKLQLLN